MDFDIREFRDYYDPELQAYDYHELVTLGISYDYHELVTLGISYDNAEFMVSIGVPEEFDVFVFYKIDQFQKLLMEDVSYIQIGHFSFCKYGLYVKEGSDEFFTTSSLHEPHLYMLNKNLRTFFLFHLIKNEVAMKMRQQGEYTSYKYACELRRLFEQIDPVPMKDVESYWSHLIEDYETGL
ncbi:hypothetical protein [Brevibacillus sp. FIR094]|uniref:hypothetical protein n=1 Tax=Brevibacillus sp. FIR094 TaxID=3134809 RepID=UPI003D1C4DA8